MVGRSSETVRTTYPCVNRIPPTPKNDKMGRIHPGIQTFRVSFARSTRKTPCGYCREERVDQQVPLARQQDWSPPVPVDAGRGRPSRREVNLRPAKAPGIIVPFAVGCEPVQAGPCSGGEMKSDCPGRRLSSDDNDVQPGWLAVVPSHHDLGLTLERCRHAHLYGRGARDRSTLRVERGRWYRTPTECEKTRILATSCEGHWIAINY